MSHNTWVSGPLWHLGCATSGKMLSVSEPWVCTATTSECCRSKGQGPRTLQTAPRAARSGLDGVQEAGQGAWTEREVRLEEGRESGHASALSQRPSTSPPTSPLPTCQHRPPRPDLVQLFPANPRHWPSPAWLLLPAKSLPTHPLGPC